MGPPWRSILRFSTFDPGTGVLNREYVVPYGYIFVELFGDPRLIYLAVLDGHYILPGEATTQRVMLTSSPRLRGQALLVRSLLAVRRLV